MSALVSATAAGFAFGLGLWISGMANPKKVLGFLDVAGNWDATLLVVMGAAVAVTFAGYRLATSFKRPLFHLQFEMPTRKDLDVPLIAGAAIFGIGWGIGGYCPGPALTAFAALTGEAIAFVLAMVAGGLLHHVMTSGGGST